MTIGVKLGNITDEIGDKSFFHAFFSTVAYHLEEKKWGVRFPVLMKKFYQGQLMQSDAGTMLEELNKIQFELKNFSPNQVVWDIEDLKLEPPWGDDISRDITDLSNYFVTSTGRDLIETLLEIFQELHQNGGVAEIVSVYKECKDNVIKLLVKDLESEDVDVIRSALKALGELGTLEAVNYILPFLGWNYPVDRNTAVNAAASFALCEMGEISLQPTIDALKVDPDYQWDDNERRCWAVHSLCRHGKEQDELITSTLINILATEHVKSEVTAEVVIAIRSRSFRHDFGALRLQVVSALENLKKKNESIFCKLNVAFRNGVIKRINKTSNKQSKNILRKWDTAKIDEIIETIDKNWKKKNGLYFIEPLVKDLESGDFETIRNALTEISEFGTLEAVNYILPFLGWVNPINRKSKISQRAAGALSKMGEVSLQSTIDALKSDFKPTIYARKNDPNSTWDNDSRRYWAALSLSFRKDYNEETIVALINTLKVAGVDSRLSNAVMDSLDRISGRSGFGSLDLEVVNALEEYDNRAEQANSKQINSFSNRIIERINKV